MPDCRDCGAPLEVLETADEGRRAFDRQMVNLGPWRYGEREDGKLIPMPERQNKPGFQLHDAVCPLKRR
jgi:hypothetical protein